MQMRHEDCCKGYNMNYACYASNPSQCPEGKLHKCWKCLDGSAHAAGDSTNCPNHPQYDPKAKFKKK